MPLWSHRAATAENRLSLKWSGRPRPYTGRTTGRSWRQWEPLFPLRVWRARSCWPEMAAGQARIPIWTQARGRRALPGMHLWPRLLPGMWETGAHLEITGAGQGRLVHPKAREARPEQDSLGRDNQARAAARSRALREISLSSIRGARAGDGIRTAVSATTRSTLSSVPTTRMCSTDVTLRTSPWRLRRSTGKSER